MSSTIICKCGNRIGLGADPNDNVYSLLSQYDQDVIVADDPIDFYKFSGLFSNSDLIVEYVICGRLIREHRDDVNPSKIHTVTYCIEK